MAVEIADCNGIRCRWLGRKILLKSAFVKHTFGELCCTTAVDDCFKSAVCVVGFHGKSARSGKYLEAMLAQYDTWLVKFATLKGRGLHPRICVLGCVRKWVISRGHGVETRIPATFLDAPCSNPVICTGDFLRASFERINSYALKMHKIQIPPWN